MFCEQKKKNRSNDNLVYKKCTITQQIYLSLWNLIFDYLNKSSYGKVQTKTNSHGKQLCTLGKHLRSIGQYFTATIKNNIIFIP